MASDNPTISFRPTSQQSDAIDEAAEDDDTTQTEAVRHYLDRGIEADARISELQAELAAVESNLEQCQRERDAVAAERDSLRRQLDEASGERGPTVTAFASVLATFGVFAAGLGITGVWTTFRADLVSSGLLLIAAVVLIEANSRPIGRALDYVRPGAGEA